ncbi:MAG: hypothetical protein B7Y41_16645, partial [Hydrogenophilales bacterium 28-61-23]
QGKVYVFKAQPYGYWVTSEEYRSAGWYDFRVGKLQIRVLDGQTGQGRADQAVLLQRWQADGHHTVVMSVRTDAQGWLKLDPPLVGQESYLVSAQSPTDGQSKASEVYRGSGPYTFVLGNAAVIGKVEDAVSGAALSGKIVEAWETLANGSLVLVAKRATDANGLTKFDLDGVGTGRKYHLKSQPYLQSVESGELTGVGEQLLKAGKLQVQVLDGRTGGSYAWRTVHLLEQGNNGVLSPQGDYATDGEGRLRLDPAHLGVQGYVVRAPSLVDGTDRDSAVYEQGGSYQFKVGGAGLTLWLKDQISNGVLVGQEVQAWEKGADGILVWKKSGITDAAGKIAFDLDGLGQGKVYVFKAQPYGYWVTSEEYRSAGWYDFRVGK